MKEQPFLAYKITYAACLKSIWICCVPLIAALVFITGCNSKKDVPGADTDPIFQQDPQLHRMTDEIKQSPADATLYAERGHLLHRMHHDSLAIKDYKSAIKLDSNKAEYYSAIGDILFEAKDISGSVEWIQKAVVKNPNDRKAHLKVAKLFLYIREYPKAFAEINKVLREDVYNPEAYFLKGMLYKDGKDTVKAISSFLTAVQVAPDYKDAIMQLGILYTAKKDPIAIRYFENAFRLDTTDVSPLYAIGVYHQGNNDYSKAKEYYRACIVRDWHYADAYFNMGYVLLQQDSVQKAYRQYDMVTRIDPRNPTGYFNRGLCKEIMDSIPQAVEDYKIAMQMDPNYKSPREALERLRKK